MRVGIIDRYGEPMAERYWNEKSVQEAAEAFPERIYYLPECWENLIGSWRYKPGWTFEYNYEIDFDQERLYIDARVPDRDNPEKLTRVSAWYNLRPWEGTSMGLAIAIIRDCIMKMEIHEMDEFILVDGDRVFDPHKPVCYLTSNPCAVTEGCHNERCAR